MARLLVEAVGAEPAHSDQEWKSLELGVSVSHTDGTPVTGLTKLNFRVADVLGGSSTDHAVDRVREAKWEPGNTTSAGCYLVSIKKKEPTGDYGSRVWHVFGVQVRTFVPGKDQFVTVLDQGQTIVGELSSVMDDPN